MGLLTADALVYGTAMAGDPQLSPDATRVAYVLGRANRDQDRSTSQIWLANINGGDPRQLTSTGERNREPRWSPDCRSLAFLSDRKQDRTGLFVLPMLQPGEAKEITNHHQSIGQVAWSPDARWI